MTPFALRGMICYVAYAPRNDANLRCFAYDLGEFGECDLGQLANARRRDASFGSRHRDFAETPWMRYVAGAWEFMHSTALGLAGPPKGSDVLVTSSVPTGAGLSSSSALTVAATLAVRDMYRDYKLKISLLDACCRAEWHFSGVQGGIMDQFASLHGQDGCAMVLDCRTRSVWRQLDLTGVDLVIFNTNVKHELRDSPYAKRRDACERVARAAGVPFLRDLSERGNEAALRTLDSLRDQGAITILDHARATHGCLENTRVKRAADAADAANWPLFGSLLNEAHASLRDLYDVSCAELDALQIAASQAKGCFGARMMGGGFGGCVLAVCAPGEGAAVQRDVERNYPILFANANSGAVPPSPSVFHAAPGAGAALLPLSRDDLQVPTPTPVVVISRLWE